VLDGAWSANTSDLIRFLVRQNVDPEHLIMRGSNIDKYGLGPEKCRLLSIESRFFGI
jgi:hypothetical protein